MRSVLIVKISLTRRGSLTTTVGPKIGMLSVNSEPRRRATAAIALSRAVTKPMPCASAGSVRAEPHRSRRLGHAVPPCRYE